MSKRPQDVKKDVKKNVKQPSAARKRPPRAPASPRRAAASLAPAAWTEAFRDTSAEWLEADGLGGFASGCASLLRTRRYHALLLSAVTPPTGRQCLVNGVEVALETALGTVALSSQYYDGDVRHPDGASRLTGFIVEPWPRWRFRLDDGAEIACEIFVPHANAPGEARSSRSSSPRARSSVYRKLRYQSGACV